MKVSILIKTMLITRGKKFIWDRWFLQRRNITNKKMKKVKKINEL